MQYIYLFILIVVNPNYYSFHNFRGNSVNFVKTEETYIANDYHNSYELTNCSNEVIYCMSDGSVYEFIFPKNFSNIEGNYNFYNDAQNSYYIRETSDLSINQGKIYIVSRLYEGRVLQMYLYKESCGLISFNLYIEGDAMNTYSSGTCGFLLNFLTFSD